jgi:hypothetical protein
MYATEAKAEFDLALGQLGFQDSKRLWRNSAVELTARLEDQ